VEKEFIKLLNNHIGIIYKICNVYFYRNPLKEDYQQEIIIQLWKAFPGFRNESEFSTWMYRVALNTAIDIKRKFHTQPQYTELTRDEFHLTDNKEIQKSDRKEKMYSAINRLNDSEKAIILLYLEGFSYNEIAGIIGISESNTGVKINRIKKQLVKLITYDREK
jgi:RNA polymerase sigma-70 factor, ECF subfamily